MLSTYVLRLSKIQKRVVVTSGPFIAPDFRLMAACSPVAVKMGPCASGRLRLGNLMVSGDCRNPLPHLPITLLNLSLRVFREEFPFIPSSTRSATSVL
uniref:WD_REPEATS_REGION domain-containing protein n=1 Tax=Mesocestoides corti TaxID=53468 RepID=A0A5K3EGN2_MESCO